MFARTSLGLLKGETDILKSNHQRTRSFSIVGLLAVCALLLGAMFPNGARGMPQVIQAAGPCDNPANAIVAENCLPGNPPSEWEISGDGDQSIQGFATDISVNRGKTVDFKIKTDATNYRLDIYRLGYYGGDGARLATTIVPTVTLPQTQPDCEIGNSTGLVDCGNWNISATWNVPASATSGIYIARLVRSDTNGASHIPFIVRDDTGASDLLFQTADTTWQAYNQYGGNSLYVGGPGVNPGRAYAVSYNRPFTTRRTSNEDWLFNAEYPMLRWLERNGYDVSYFTGVDSDRFGSEILEHKVFLSVGHDEYWSGVQRANVEAARDVGTHLAFFSSNEVFWKTRWESSIAGTSTPYRTLVSYKETLNSTNIDPSSEWTGTWRDSRAINPEGGNPENALTGQLFTVNCCSYALTVPAADGKMRFWRNTSIATLAPAAIATLPQDILGYEWDEDLDNGVRPAGLIRMSTTTVDVPQRIQDFGRTYGPGAATHHLTLYKHRSGALVFGAGTLQWTWGLDSTHDRGGTPADPRMQQATLNLFADMDAQPASLQSNLVAATASTDTTAPTTAITSPTSGATVQGTITISGTASDTGGGVVGGVEVSVDNGATWHPADGRETWSHTWTPDALGSMTIRSRAADDSGNLGAANAGVTVTVEPRACPCSIWEGTVTPENANANDNQPYELGVKFRTSRDGYITGLRFYKGSQNTGTHVGHLWSSTGTQLAEAAFVNETASGWQKVVLAQPVAVTANTTYVASYYTGNYYAFSDDYFTNAVDNAPLRALASGEDGLNGVFKEGASGFPTNSFRASNYWVDVVFETTVGEDITGPTVVSITPAANASDINLTANVSVVFNELVDEATVSGDTFELRDASNSLVPATVSYNAATRTATLNPTSSLANATTYSALVKSGTNGVKDVAGNPLATDRTWSFTTVGTPLPPPNEGPGGPILVVADAANPFSRYYAEILRAEGLNAFTVTDIIQISPTILNGYDVVILGEMTLSSAQVTLFSNWVNAGGNLIAMRPDAQLAGLLGLSAPSGTLDDTYLQVNTSVVPGTGITNQTIQFHGKANRYTLDGAAAVATLYSNATTATSNPAVTLRSVGSNGGQAAAWAFDLARSVVYTRQGNPDWAGQNRDAAITDGVIRSNDLFYGGNEPDWVNLTKVPIPQADEQQRLLANMIGTMNADRKPLPRFWYFPRGEKAVVVMTHDDHGGGNIVGRINRYNQLSPANCNVDDWDCVRSTTYLYTNSQISDSQVNTFQSQGHEFGIHVNTGCGIWTPAGLANDYTTQLAAFENTFPSATAQRTHRTHCIAWSDWATQPKVELANGIRLDTNYYYWPSAWIQNRPGMFTGSGIPMRFADLDGTLIDVYQATTQMTDESGQSYPLHIDALLDKALGSEGYYGAFTTNLHTDGDSNANNAAEAVVASAQTRGVPVISARQMLTWLDGRNASSFGNIAWSGNTLSFTVDAASGARGLRGMVPAQSNGATLQSLIRGGSAVPFTVETIKGVSYAMFSATDGTYAAQYDADSTAPTVTATTPAAGAASVPVTSKVAVQFSELIEPATLSSSTFELRDAANALVAASITYDASTSTATLTPNAALATNTQYSATVRGGTGGVSDLAGNSLIGDTTWSFTTSRTAFDCPCSIWNNTVVPANTTGSDSTAVEVGVRFRSTTTGYITGIRFYRGSNNTGPFVGHLWSNTGTLLGTATFNTVTATGWREALFPTPVAISANTTYVASYFTQSGNYAFDTNYFTTTGVDTPPLRALQNGEDGPNGVYIYGPTGGFPTQTFNAANYWVDVVFDTTLPADTTPPVISAVSATVDANGTATINWTTDEPATSRVSYGTAANALTQSKTESALETAHSITLTGLTPGTTYYYRVSSTDADNNMSTTPPTANAPLSFSTPATTTNFADTTVADFTAGTAGACYVAQTANGEITLAPAVGAEFFGTSLPTGWSSTAWNSGGAATVANGVLSVDGALARTNATYGPGSVLEFVATFGQTPFQAVGFTGATEPFNAAPWVMFGTKQGDQVYARTWVSSSVGMVDVPLGTNWLGSPHMYRIEWDLGQIRFLIDGVLRHTETVTVTASMVLGASDFNTGGTAVTVDWMRLTPYSSPCAFESRVLDAGSTADWLDLTASVVLPGGTAVSFEVRSGNTPTPDASWSAWSNADASIMAPDGRYLQYRVTLTSSDPDRTPVVERVTVSYQAATPVTSTATPTSTPTDTPTNMPTATATNTPVPPTNTPTDTPTNTPVPPTSTPTDTPTNTSIPSTNTPTATATNTPVPPTSTPTDTPTNTPIPSTNTPTDTPTTTPTATATNTPVPPTSTPTATVTSTPVTGPTAIAITGSTGTYFEVEAYSAATGPWRTIADSSRSGGAYVDTPNKSGNKTGSFLRYDLDVTSGGSFYLYVLSTGPDGRSDSFFVSVDTGTRRQLTTGRSNQWAWKRPTGTFSMPTGRHTLYIYVREDGARADRIFLSKSSTFPTDSSAPAATTLDAQSSKMGLFPIDVALARRNKGWR